ncbi:MAG: hypothetical protein SF069_18970 [Phycisphaerae bacterium]|nr:hypothetical protein [Phycisphaerae bacterium]
MKGNAAAKEAGEGMLLRLPGVELRLTAEQALRAAIDNQVFAALRDLESLNGGRAVQAVYVALVRRLPNVTPDRKRLAIDTGFSESSVKRAIKLLELCRLLSVEREAGKGSVFFLADIRSPEVASECVFAIRRVVRSESRVTSDPASTKGRATSDPGTRVTSGPGVGSLLTHKEAKKNQDKQQGAAASNPEELSRVLSKWGLSSASYLVRPGHERAIPLLAQNPVEAGRLIERTMRKVAWSPAAGVGARVEYLRENVERTACEAAATGHRKDEDREHTRRRAEKVALELTRGEAAELSDVEPQRFAKLLTRGLERLSEPAGVREFLKGDAAACRAIVRDELCREEIERRVAAMPAAEFEMAFLTGAASLTPSPSNAANKSASNSSRLM